MPLNAYDDLLERIEGEQSPRPAKPVNLYDALLASDENAKRAQLGTALEQAAKTPPDKRAESIRLAEQYRMPVDIVERNLDFYRATAKAKDTNLLNQSPKFAEWLLSDPDALAIAQNDIRRMVQIEHAMTLSAHLLKAGDNIQSMFGSTLQWAGEAIGSKRIAEYGGSVAQFNREQADALGYTLTWEDVKDRPWLFDQWFLGGLTEQVPQLAVTIGAGLAAAASAPAVGVGATVGGFLGAFVPSFVLNTGEVQAQLKEIDPEASAPLTVFVGGSASAALDSISGGSISAMLRRQFGKEAAEEIAKRALLQPVKQAAPKFLTSSAAQVGRGSIEEMIPEALQTAIADYAAASGTGTDVDWKATWTKMVEAGLLGGITGGAARGGAHVMSFPRQLEAFRRQAAAFDVAQQQKEFFNALADNTKESELYQKSPQKFQAAVAAMTKDGPVKDVTIDTEPFVEYWTSKKVDPALIASELTGEANALEKAQASGAQLVIPMAAYAAKLAATDHHAFFVNELRLQMPDGRSLPNAREAKQQQEQLLEDVENLQAAVDAAAAGTETAEAKASPVRQALAAQILADQGFQQMVARAAVDPATVANVYATVMESIANTMARQAGVDPADILAGERLTIGPQGTVDAIRAVLQARSEAQSLEVVPAGEGVTNNASGESSASVEGINRAREMKKAGETFVVYGRDGVRRSLEGYGVDGVDYVARPGETYGVEDAAGVFHVRDDLGGRIPTVGSTPDVSIQAPDPVETFDLGNVGEEDALEGRLLAAVRENRPMGFATEDELSAALNSSDPLEVATAEDEVAARVLDDQEAIKFYQGPKLPPGAARVTKHLLPEEAKSLRADTARRMMDVFAELPADADYVAAARAGIVKRGWYIKSANAIRDVFGEVDGPRFAALLAALSPRTSVEANLLNAVTMWKNWNAADRPTDVDTIKALLSKSVQGAGQGSVLHAWINNTVTALTTEDDSTIVLSGPKVNPFMRNLMGHLQHVTTDTWMAVFAGSIKAVTSGGLTVSDHHAYAAKTRRVAAQINRETGETWSPAEVQETVWSWAKTMYELAEAQGKTAEQVLREGLITDEAINSTPDFATLFQTDAPVRSILEAAGYGPVIDALANTAAPGGRSGAEGTTGSGARREGAAVSPGLLRSARRLDTIRAQRQAFNTVDYPGLIAALQTNGGFTHSIIEGVPRVKGLAIAMYPQLGQPAKGQPPIHIDDLTMEHLVSYVTKNAGVLAQKGNHFGAWVDNGNVFLDVSRVVSTPAEAQRLGKLHDQIAYFNLATFESVPIEYEEGYQHGETWQGPEGPNGIHGTVPDAGGDSERAVVSAAVLPDDGPQGDTGGNSSGGTATVVAFDADPLSGVERTDVEGEPQLGATVKLYQDPPAGEEDARGSIDFGPDGVRIAFGATSDLSTMVHELAHFYQRVMAKLVARIRETDSQTWTPGQLKLVTDFDTLMSHVGATSYEALTRVQHEQLARSFEAYLALDSTAFKELPGAEDVERNRLAPSPELVPAFGRMRSWMLKVYSSMDALGVELNPEIVEVFDRMFATEEAIAQAEAEVGVTPFFATAELAGMDPFEWQGYQKEMADVHERAVADVQSRLIEELKREQSKWWRDRTAEVRATIAAELRKRPVYRALFYLQRDEDELGNKVPDDRQVKLSKDAIVERFGANWLKHLPLPYVYRVEGGVDPDVAAELFGFTSGDALLTALAQAEKFDTVVNRETQIAMKVQYGDMRKDGTLRAAAKVAVQVHGYEEVLERELRAVARLANQVKPIVRAATGKVAAEEASAKRAARSALALVDQAPAAKLRAIAEATIAKLPAKDIRPHLYWRAARQEGAKAAKALLAGKYEEAVAAKQRQRLAVAHHRVATEAVAEAEKFGRYARNLEKPAAQARLGQAGETYQQQVNAILLKFELAPVSNKGLQRRANLKTWVDSQLEAGFPIDVPAELLEAMAAVNYRSLPMHVLRDVRDTLKQIVHLANLKNRLLDSADQRTFEEQRDALVASLLEKNKKRKDVAEFRNKERQRLSVEDIFASHRKLATIVQQLDGNEDNGIFWRLFVKPLNRAADLKQQRQESEGELYNQIVQRHYPGAEIRRWNQKVEIPGLGISLARETIIAMGLNQGTDTNKNRLENDPSPGRQWSAQQRAMILDQLDARDWQFIQDTIDHLERFWPEISDKMFRVTGLRPEKVDATPIVTKYGTFRGGYYPIAYDNRLSPEAATHTAVGEAKLQLAGAYISQTTRRGHEQARLDTVKRPLRLEIGVMFNHIEQVVHDLTHHEALLDVTRIVRDRKVIAALQEVAGPVQIAQLKAALGDIAQGLQDKDHLINRGAAFAKTGTQIASLGLNLWTMLQQPTGLFNGAARVGPKWVMRGMMRWLRTPATMEGSLQWIYSVSPFMKGRAVNATQDMSDLRNKLSEPGGWFDNLVRKYSGERLTQQALTDGFLIHISLAQRVADVPTWLGQYEKSRARGLSEADAVAVADQAVRDSQGSGQIVDLSKVQRGGPAARLFMVFYTYGATVYNQTSRAYGRTEFRKPEQAVRFLGDLSLIYVLPALATVLLAKLTGKDDDEDDAAAFLAKVGGESISSAMNGVVGLREFSSAVRDGGNRGYAGPTGTRIFKEATGLITQIKQGEADAALWHSFNNTAGILFRYPSTQAQKSVDGFLALYEGETDNPLALLFGPPRK